MVATDTSRTHPIGGLKPFRGNARVFGEERDVKQQPVPLLTLLTPWGKLRFRLPLVIFQDTGNLTLGLVILREVTRVDVMANLRRTILDDGTVIKKASLRPPGMDRGTLTRNGGQERVGVTSGRSRLDQPYVDSRRCAKAVCAFGDRSDVLSPDQVEEAVVKDDNLLQ